MLTVLLVLPSSSLPADMHAASLVRVNTHVQLVTLSKHAILCMQSYRLDVELEPGYGEPVYKTAAASRQSAGKSKSRSYADK